MPFLLAQASPTIPHDLVAMLAGIHPALHNRGTYLPGQFVALFKFRHTPTGKIEQAGFQRA